MTSTETLATSFQTLATNSKSNLYRIDPWKRGGAFARDAVDTEVIDQVDAFADTYDNCIKRGTGTSPLDVWNLSCVLAGNNPGAASKRTSRKLTFEFSVHHWPTTRVKVKGIEVNLIDADGKTVAEHKVGSADDVTLFMQELLDSVETLTSIAEQHGTRTLVDLMYLQAAILDGGHIDHYPDESAVMDIASSLPSGERWSKYIKSDYMAQRVTFAA